MTVRIRRVLAPNPGPFTLEGTNTWVVGEGPSVVIDPGPDHPGHLLAVLDEAEPVEAILLTHHHDDHAEGASRLAAASSAPVLAFRPAAGETRVADGEMVGAGEVRLRAVHAPGHTPDHLVFLLDDERALFTGDAVLGRGTSVVDPPEGDMGDYLRSLRAMQALGAERVYPGHGPLVVDAPARLREYVEHRALRERQIVESLARGPATSAELVPGIYGHEVPDSLHPAAGRSVLAHLLKLEREGRVRRADERGDEAGDDVFALVEDRPCERCGRPALPRSRYCRQCAVVVLQEGPAG